MKTPKKPGTRKYDVPFPAAPAMHRAAQRAREVARLHGTPIYVSRNGKIVALKP